MVLKYLQIQSKACASLCFSASPPRIGYFSLWMHQGLSPPWFTAPRGISATCNMKSRSDQIPHPLWVVIKCPSPGKTKFIKFPPSRAAKYVKCPGYAWGGGMFKLRFEWYITAKSPSFDLLMLDTLLKKYQTTFLTPKGTTSSPVTLT